MQNWTAITPRSGGLTHITSLEIANRSACGKAVDGWVVSLKAVSCLKCKAAVHLSVKVK